MLKNSRALTTALLSLFVGGCVASQPLPQLGQNHPAHPEAPEVAPAPVSRTLAIQPTTEPASLPSSAPVEGGHHHGH